MISPIIIHPDPSLNYYCFVEDPNIPLLKTKYALPVLLPLLLFAGCATARKGPRNAYAKAAGIKPFDAIIVPGVPYYGRGWDSVMKSRVLWSYILYRNGYAKNIIYSGAAV